MKIVLYFLLLTAWMRINGWVYTIYNNTNDRISFTASEAMPFTGGGPLYKAIIEPKRTFTFTTSESLKKGPLKGSFGYCLDAVNAFHVDEKGRAHDDNLSSFNWVFWHGTTCRNRKFVITRKKGTQFWQPPEYYAIE